MYLFLDESGDLGFDFQNKKPSYHFLMSLLVCETKEALFGINNAVKRTLHKKVNYKAKQPKKELKGNDTSLSVKRYFYRHVQQRSDFQLYTVILDKKRLLNQVSRVEQHRIYVRLCTQVLNHMTFSENLSFVHLWADRCKRGVEARDLNTLIRYNLENRLPLTTRITLEQVPSSEHYGLQAVDMFSYGFYRKHEHHDLDWYNVFNSEVFSEVVI